MKITAHDYAQALWHVVSPLKGAEADEAIQRFAKLLTDRGQLSLLPAIQKELVRLEQHQDGITPVQVTVARERVAGASITDELQSLFGKRIAVSETIDPTILGGLVAETDNERLDASLRQSLRQMNKILSS